MKKTCSAISALLIIAAPLLVGLVQAEPIKWSAPMSVYPRAWTPTPAPPPANYGNYGYNSYYGFGHNYMGYGYAQPRASYSGGLSGYYNQYYGY
jgi:hypothetical protein